MNLLSKFFKTIENYNRTILENEGEPCTDLSSTFSYLLKHKKALDVFKHTYTFDALVDLNKERAVNYMLLIKNNEVLAKKLAKFNVLVKTNEFILTEDDIKKDIYQEFVINLFHESLPIVLKHNASCEESQKVIFYLKDIKLLFTITKKLRANCSYYTDNSFDIHRAFFLFDNLETIIKKLNISDEALSNILVNTLNDKELLKTLEISPSTMMQLSTDYQAIVSLSSSLLKNIKTYILTQTYDDATKLYINNLDYFEISLESKEQPFKSTQDFMNRLSSFEDI